MYTYRNICSDALSEGSCKLAFEFWPSPGNSRPTGNKSNVNRKQLGPKEYIEHEKQILEKTQSEIFQDFKKKYPEIGIKWRAFENCKPFLLSLLHKKTEILVVATSMWKFVWCLKRVWNIVEILLPKTRNAVGNLKFTIA